MCFSFSLVLSAWAQDRVVTGKVTSNADGSPLPGVNVLLKGTTSGTVTTADGKYSLSVANGAAVLSVSFIGFKTVDVEIGERTIVDIGLDQDATQLAEVVVTALGIERNKNELAYASQSVSSDQVVQARNNNFVNSLSGRVAGLDIKTNNTMGGATNVVIRGMKSITGSNQALFVIDGVPVSNDNQSSNVNTGQASGGGGPDYGNAAADINPDNIASVNVLKGAAATALYGSRGTNGVIMITTKSGKKKSFEVVVNSGVTWGTINKSTFPTYQKEYGAGYENYIKNGTAYTYTGLDGTLTATRFDDDASFGPKFDPNLLVYQWSALDPFSPNYQHATPWVAAKNDPSTFYETSTNSNQSILITGGSENATYKFGYTRTDEKGVLPNSSLKKDLFSFSTTMDLTSKLKLTTSVNYSVINGLGRYGTGYSGLNPNQGFRQWWEQNVDIKELREAYFRNRKNVTWNWASTAGLGPIFADNPYWDRYENYNNDTRNNLFGYAMLDYKLAKWLTVVGRVGLNQTSDFIEQRVAVGSASTSSYTRFNQTSKEKNFDLMLNFNKAITDNISWRAVVGGNIRRNENSSIRGATVSGLVVPSLYTLSNSSGTVVPVETYTRVGVDGMYINTTFGYKDIAFVEGSLRQDKSTTLPNSNNSYLYGSVGGTFVFSTLLSSAPWLSSGRLRTNFATVGNSAPALSIYNVYDKPSPFGTTTLFSLPNTRNNALLRPEKTTSWEVGLEAAFLNDRFGFDATYYSSSTSDQILPVTVSAATGYTAAFVNSGEIQNKGIELSVFATPVKTADFSWTVNVNFARNRNKVIYLYGEGAGEVTNVQIASFQGGVSTNAAKGQPYGVIRGRDFVYTNGQRTVGSDGYYMRGASSADIIGNPNPDWLGGLNNTFKYKNFTFNFLLDTRQGGSLFSLDLWYGENTGQYRNSAGLNARGVEARLPVAQGGGVLLPGVQADGSANTVYAENFDANGNNPFGYFANNGLSAVNKAYIYNASYIKLREVNLTYSVPKSIVSKLGGFKGMDVSLIGRNLFIIKDLPYSDPEESLSSGNANAGYQSGAYPSMRSYGFNVKLKF
ncbi:SusC/RagA family TonB-linked outer membrane protein [Cytophagales bacterium WSM2-2]|nr:SusC/RagA family TonB-linked outer membrane protein [Cytophagales bacterium WSM2-2]